MLDLQSWTHLQCCLFLRNRSPPEGSVQHRHRKLPPSAEGVPAGSASERVLVRLIGRFKIPRSYHKVFFQSFVFQSVSYYASPGPGFGSARRDLGGLPDLHICPSLLEQNFVEGPTKLKSTEAIGYLARLHPGKGLNKNQHHPRRHNTKSYFSGFHRNTTYITITRNEVFLILSRTHPIHLCLMVANHLSWPHNLHSQRPSPIAIQSGLVKVQVSNR